MALSYGLFVGSLLLTWARDRRAYLNESHGKQPAVKPAWEYRSGAALFGLPLVHIRIGGDMRANRTPVRAWIAIGDTAIGALFAYGAVAVAPLSIGGFAIGLLPFGGATLGVVALGGFSVGIWSFGGLAFGWQAFGGCAIAWNAAVGGVAIAYQFAHGAIAYATQTDRAVTDAFLGTQPFFRIASYLFEHFLAWLNFIWLLPLIIWSRMVRRAKDNRRIA